MSNDNYWADHWSSHEKLSKKDPQEQVARTKLGAPISEEDWKATSEHIKGQLEVRDNQTLLDLCCGNGLLSAFLIEEVQSIDAIDFSKQLLDQFVSKSERINRIYADITSFEYEDEKYDRIVFYYAIQHLDLAAATVVISKLFKALKPGGILLIGDIPDEARKWKFYSKEDYKNFYFSNLSKSVYPVGTWYDKKFIENLGYYCGFKEVRVSDQPEFLLNSNHRFDAILLKS